MKSTLMIAVAGLTLLSVAACNRAEDETAMPADDATMAAGDTAMDASGAAPASDGAMAPQSGTSSSAGSTTSSSETMNPAGTSSATPGSAMPMPANPTQEQIEATRGTLSPAGASSGATAPPPQ